MKLVIDARTVFQPDYPEPTRYFFGQLIAQAISGTPGLQVVLLNCLTESDARSAFPAAGQTGFIQVPARRGAGHWFWEKFQWPAVIRREKADAVLCLDSLPAPIHSIPFAVWPVHREFSGSALAQWMNKTDLKKSFLITGLPDDKRWTGPTGSQPPLHRIPFAADKDYRVLDWTEKESAKIQWAAGREYFLVNTRLTEARFIEILKAFSKFKKRQQSNMQMVFAGQAPDFSLEKLESYKYRQDVHWHTDLRPDALRTLAGAAYALLVPDRNEPLVILNALRAGVPVIALQDIFPDNGDAVLWVNEDNWSDQMMILFKDESFRATKIAAGRTAAEQFNMETSVEQFRALLSKQRQS